MAELRNAQSAVEALAAQVAVLRQQCGRESEPFTSEEAVIALQTALQSVLDAMDGDDNVTMEKFRERTKAVDPVTNEPRFGPKTMAKVVNMLQRYDALRKEVMEGDLVSRVRHQIDSHELAKAEAARRAEELRRQKVAQEEVTRLREQSQRRREAEEQSMQQQLAQEAEQRRVAELARLAQQVREERRRQKLIDDAKIAAEQERLARQNETVEIGIAGLSKAVTRLRDGIQDKTLYRKSLQKLHALVSNVCASPENPAFRHIPKENAHFHQDIGQFDGGHQCLLAIGFKELEPEPGKRIFIMEEPDLSQDMDKWSNWFDGLKEMKQWLEEIQQSST